MPSIFDKVDNIFFSIMLKYKNIFEDVIKQSYLYDIPITKEHIYLQKDTIEITNIKNKKKSINKIICFCIYDKQKQLFRWLNGINEIFITPLFI